MNISLAPAAPKRLTGLDGLRAIALILVVAHHLSFSWAFAVPEPFKAIVREGRFGVNIFFVLSGFLITWLLLGEEGKTGTTRLGRFYFRRAFRILPAAGFYLVAVGLLAALRVIDLPAVDLVYCATFVRNLAYGQYGPNPHWGPFQTGHYWSLSIEEQFYLFWPLLFLVTRGRTRIWMTVAFVVAAPLWRSAAFRMGIGLETALNRTDLRFDPLMVGCLLALLREDPGLGRVMRGRGLQSGWLMLALLPVLVGFGLYEWTLAERVPVVMKIRFLAPSITYVTIALCINYLIEDHRDLVSRALNTRPLAWVGKMSYSLYLWQQLFCLPSDKEPVMAYLRWFPVNVLATLAMGMVSYYLVETPFLRWRDRLEAKKRQPAPAAPQSAGEPAPQTVPA